MRSILDSNERAVDVPARFDGSVSTSILSMAMAISRAKPRSLPDADADVRLRCRLCDGYTCPCVIASMRPILPMAVAMRNVDRSGSADVD